MTEQMGVSTNDSQAAGKLARRLLELELVEVEQRLGEALSDLFPPFSQMVAAQLRSSRPLMRAAVVLAAGVASPDHDVLREQRLNLAAALEMLHLAINVHMLLGSAATGEAPNPSLLGSTILAGDYCFSRSANLAVLTEDRAVVEIFSDALKQVSEGHLRHFFNPVGEPYNEDHDLFVAGVTAAMHLTQASEQARGAATRLVEALAAQPKLAENEERFLTLLRELQSEVAPAQSQRWAALLAWRAEQ
jgi:octaprenyl-diphosphate synthase